MNFNNTESSSRRRRRHRPSTKPQHTPTSHPTESTTASAFAKLGLCSPLLRALRQEGYSEPTPIQTQTIPHLLTGSDLIGCAQTGTGKTAAFLLPVLQRLSEQPATGRLRALVLTPTRELAAQIAERAAAYGAATSLRHTLIFGGVSQRGQERELKKRPDLLIATPGRLLDLMQQNLVQLSSLEVLVLDEADTMLDMGFLPDVRKIVAAVPKKRQTLLFSATMPTAIESLAQSILRQPKHVAVARRSQAAATVEQSVYHVPQKQKTALLERVLQDTASGSTLVFTRTKRGANRVSAQLTRSGIEAAVIHGNKSQNARTRALSDFKQGRARVLVATDIAARGIDIDDVSHVINFELPNVPECYVHRIGRTGRAGATGAAISFCDSDERGLLRDIERLLKKSIPVAPDSAPAAAQPAREGARTRSGPARNRSLRRGRGAPRRRDVHSEA